MCIITFVISLLLALMLYLMSGKIEWELWILVYVSLLGWAIESAGVSIKRGFDDLAVGKIIEMERKKKKGD